MASPLRLVVGLGNPGQKYLGTRHNIGRDFIDHVASGHNEEFSERRQAEFFRLSSFFGLELSRPVIFAKLDCFMNESGPTLQGLMARDGVKTQEILVIVDEFMIPYGALRLKPEGSAGGHNGLKSIIAAIGTQTFSRLRVGVGPVPLQWDPADFVLGRFSPAERDNEPKLFDAVTGAVKAALFNEMERAMSAVNKVHF